MPFYHGLKDYKNDPNHPQKAEWIAKRLLALRHDLAVELVNGRQANSLVIGSWNIRAFDWGIPRFDESFHYIAEIIGAFDICAIQEVKSDLDPLIRIVKLLGPNWDYFVTDISDHEGGNSERMAFVFNTNKVFFRNLIGEIVIGRDALSSGNQIARSPFFAAFQAGWFRFTLVSSHVIFGETDAEGLALRAEEIAIIAEAVVKRAKTEDQVYLFLGDMNIDSKDGVVMNALKSSGLEVPDFVSTNMDGTKYYDQMAYTIRGKATQKTRLLRHGVFDWRNALFPYPETAINHNADPDYVQRISFNESLSHYEPRVSAHRTAHGKTPYTNFRNSYKRWTTEEMSDHLPIWIELETDYSEQYLMRFADEP